MNAVKPALKALYAEVGSPRRLERIVRAFYERMAADAMLGFFFSGKDLPAIASRQSAFLLKAMGAAESYSGKAPAQAHAALPPILRGHFDRRLRILESVLRDEGISEAGIQAWVAFEEAFRASVQQSVERGI